MKYLLQDCVKHFHVFGLRFDDVGEEHVGFLRQEQICRYLLNCNNYIGFRQVFSDNGTSL